MRALSENAPFVPLPARLHHSLAYSLTILPLQASCQSQPPTVSFKNCTACKCMYFTPTLVPAHNHSTVTEPWGDLVAFRRIYPTLHTPWLGAHLYKTKSYPVTHRPGYVSQVCLVGMSHMIRYDAMRYNTI